MGNYRPAVPTEQRHRDAALRRVAAGADDDKVHFTAFEQADDATLALGANVHAQVRVMLLEPGNGFRQHEARLRMRGGQRQLAVRFFAQVRRQGADVACFVQDAAGTLQHLPAGRCHGVQTLAATGEYLKTQFAFELLELLADARLGGVNVVGGERDVKAGVGDGDNVAKLREGHEIDSRMGDVQGCALRMAQHIQLTNHPGRRFIMISAIGVMPVVDRP
jgi:hypothetical protein